MAGVRSELRLPQLAAAIDGEWSKKRWKVTLACSMLSIACVQ